MKPHGGATYPAQEVSDDDESEALGEFVFIHGDGRRRGHGLHLCLDGHEDRYVSAKSVSNSQKKFSLTT